MRMAFSKIVADCRLANERFYKLTRKSMKLRLEENNDFCVQDFMNEGKIRNIKTLSGGELFQASLALAVALYIEGGIRAVEIGSLMFAYTDDKTGETVYPKLELVRLAIPRRVYTRAHLDCVVQTVKKVMDNRHHLKGLQITYQPKLLRHFTVELEEIS